MQSAKTPILEFPCDSESTALVHLSRRAVLAAGQNTNGVTLKFIVLSDLHLIADNGLLHGNSPSERLDLCLDDIQSWHGDAAFCVVLGDLADLGEPEAYAYLKARLARFPLPVFLMLGNHDDQRAFQATFPETPREFIQHSHEADGHVFLFLDTVMHRSDAHDGVLCDDRLAWLKSKLAQAGDKPVHIFMHHPPFDIGIAYVDNIKLQNGADFARVLTSGAIIRQVYFGHVHRMASVLWNGVPFVSVPSLNHQVPLVPESVSDKYSDEPPAYAVVQTEGAQTIVHFNAFLQRSSLMSS